MQPGIHRYYTTDISKGSHIKTTQPIRLNGNIGSISSRLVRLQIPQGVEGEVIGDGLTVGQKIVKLLLYSENGIPVEIHCPVGVNEIESNNT